MDFHGTRRASRALTAIVCVLVTLISIEALNTLRAVAADEVRALWVRRTSLDSPDSIRKMIAAATTAGFNTLFVQVADDPTARPQTDFDAVAQVVTDAHSAGLRVHAWVDIARVSAPDELPSARDHVIYQHPEWLMVPRALAAELLSVDPHSPDYVGRLARWTRANGTRADGLYLSPLQPDAAAHVAGFVFDLVRRYAFEGVYLDHAWYPTDEFDYGRRSIEQFRTFMRRQLSPTDRQRLDSIEPIDPFAYENEFPEQWRAFRQSQLTALVARVRTTIKGVRSTAIVSASVTADPGQAERDHMQDWRTWLDNGFLDALCPMVLPAGATQVSAQLAEVLALAAPRPVWATIGANRLSQRETLDGIQAARRAGANGVILFSYDSLISPPNGNEYLSAIGRGAFAGS